MEIVLGFKHYEFKKIRFNCFIVAILKEAKELIE